MDKKNLELVRGYILSTYHYAGIRLWRRRGNVSGL